MPDLRNEILPLLQNLCDMDKRNGEHIPWPTGEVAKVLGWSAEQMVRVAHEAEALDRPQVVVDGDSIALNENGRAICDQGRGWDAVL